MTQKKLWAAHATYDGVGEDQVLALRASGLAVRKVCALCGGTTRQLYHWLDKGKGADEPLEGWTGNTRRERWNEASKLCAEAIVDGTAANFEALRDPETGRMRVDVTREEIALTTAEANFNKWRVGTMDPDTFGDRPAAGTTNITIGALHIAAVKAASERAKLPKPVEVIEDAEYEEVSVDGES